MRKICYILLLFALPFAIQAQDTTMKHLQAVRVGVAPKIDGELDEEIWKTAPIAKDFIQDEPDYKKAATQRTEVKVLYDDVAVYIGAYMYDTNPDSILHELGNRDDDNLNADYFLLGFDTYDKKIDAFIFGVTASGVQEDIRAQDDTYSAVWFSEVKLKADGWCVEIKIPYSALRFPASKIQNWGAEFERRLRRRRERSRWTFIPKDQDKFIRFFGRLDSVSNIRSPLRLSLTPYVSAYAESSPEYNSDGTYTQSNSLSYSAGADLKYGIDERFTLDMILFPDFGQVQSDKKVKNLSYREVQYDENRPFFKEGTELFTKDGLFYSRRIGKTPSLFYYVPYLLDPGETVESNPSQTKLLNATKLSGRTNGGLGIGFFNAITDNMYASIRDSLGNHRKLLTEPLSNYNILVLDQQLKNSSSVYLINTNVVHDKNWGYANVTGSGFQLVNKKNTIQFSGNGALSERFIPIDTIPGKYNNIDGYKYFVALEKIGGNYTYGVKHEALNSTYDQRDMGFFTLNNYRNYVAFGSYNQYVAGKYFRFSHLSGNFHYAENFTTNLRTNLSIDLNSFAMLKKYIGIFGGGGAGPTKNYDYYEPRVPGLVYINRRYYYLYAGISTDYRKKIAFDLKGNYAHYINEGIGGPFYEINPGFRFRFSDKLFITLNSNFSHDEYNEGFANFDSLGNPIIGGRQLNTFENGIGGRYIFSNKMSLSLNARHYWNTGHYVKYYDLNADGTIAPNTTYTGNNDFSFNAFTIDLVYVWIFSPGSQLSLAYKNVIETNNNITVIPRFDDNFSKTLLSPQINTISFKFLYYLDYQNLKRKKKN